jgi:hypothetical protein
MRYAVVYGGIAGAAAIAVIVTGMALDLTNHTTSMWFGYLVMLAALSLIFVGVKRYRDAECGGVIRFGRALVLGLAIGLVAAIVYVAGWELYQAATGFDFMADYSANVLEGMRAKGASAAAIQAKTAELRELAANYQNPLFRLPMTFIEIFPVAVAVALVSALVLRNPRVLPAVRR